MMNDRLPPSISSFSISHRSPQFELPSPDNLTRKIGIKANPRATNRAGFLPKSLIQGRIGAAIQLRKGWDIIVPGEFNGDGITDLLFYDRQTGTGEFYAANGLGQLFKLSTATNWRKTWDLIVPGNFNGDGLTDLLFYDRQAGTGEFFSTDGQGGIFGLNTATNWRTSWDIIVAGQLEGNGATDDLLFYDRKAGAIETYRTTNQAQLVFQSSISNWRKSWDMIIPGNFDGDPLTDFLFHDRRAGTSKVYTVAQPGVLLEYDQGTMIDRQRFWTDSIPGDFNRDGITDILFSGFRAGTARNMVGQIYISDGKRNLITSGVETQWKRFWTSLIPGNFNGDSATDVFFYDQRTGRAEFNRVGLDSSILQNISNPGLASLTNAAIWDGLISRQEMEDMLRSIGNDNRVTKAELSELNKIINNLPMTNDVRSLARKVTTHQIANTRSRIGNLRVGNRQDTVNQLVDKWFDGKYLPTFHKKEAFYSQNFNSLFSISPTNPNFTVDFRDVEQGKVGNCYFMASLAAIAYRAPNAIRSMFIDNQDGTYTVRFFNKGKADYVTVDRQLPFLPSIYSGNWLYAGANGNLWAALAEKAYAQINESGWIGQNNRNSYPGIANGQPYNAIEHITGDRTGKKRVFRISRRSLKQLVQRFNQGQAIVLSSRPFITDRAIVKRHAYALINYDPVSQQFQLYNPYGVDYHQNKPATDGADDGLIWVTRQQILKSFFRFDFSQNADLWKQPDTFFVPFPII